MSELRIMGGAGDAKITWDKKNTTEVDIARDAFNKAKTKGMLAFKVKKDGAQGKVIKEFDPDAEKIILAPPIVGG